MRPGLFLGAVDHERVVQAIASAETRTSGEIRVLVLRKAAPDPMPEALNHFIRLGMDKTRDRNGVLIFVAPSSRTFAVVGDQAVHEKCGAAFWTAITEVMGRQFKEGAFTEGLVGGIAAAGMILSRHFPRRPDDTNELPDAVEEQ